jgi:hypothetical protein
MADGKQDVRGAPLSIPPSPSPLAPILMMAFWMLLGGATGITAAQRLWHLFDLGAGDVAVAVPVGGVVGAAAGALLGLVTGPRLLVLLMAVFAGVAAGGVAGRLPWGAVGELAGQAIGGLLGATAWAIWLFSGRERAAD